MDSLQECEQAAVAAVAKGAGPFAGVTYHQKNFEDPTWAGHCYGVMPGTWIPPVTQANIDSAKNISFAGTAVYVADLNSQPGGKPAKFDGLRLGKQRAIRAKYPNGDPEKSGEWSVLLLCSCFVLAVFSCTLVLLFSWLSVL